MTDTSHRIALLGRALRDAEVDVSLTDELDATRALTLIDVEDVDELRRALRISLKIPRAAWDLLDRLFLAIWAGGDTSRPVSNVVAATRAGASRGGRFPQWDSDQSNFTEEVTESEGELPGYSPHPSGRRAALPACSTAEVAALKRALARWAKRLATLPSRRLVPTNGRGFVDTRRSLRRSVRTAGEMVSLARRHRAREVPRLAFLCDTSGSMSAHARFLLSFALALRCVAPRTEVFAFNTTLTRLTPWLSPARIALTLERLQAGVPDWGGGTRIGESLADFAARRGAVDGRTVVVILSDGLDRGDTDRLREAMRRIRARARKVVWLNPLLRDPRYRPEARGMEAALPFVDHFGAAHDAASLERLLPLLVA